MLSTSPRKILLFLALASSLAAVACGTTSTPRTRVARDLGCSAEQTRVERLEGNHWQVTGCGRTALYVCTQPVRDCWRQGEIYPEGTSFRRP